MGLLDDPDFARRIAEQNARTALQTFPQTFGQPFVSQFLPPIQLAGQAPVPIGEPVVGIPGNGGDPNGRQNAADQAASDPESDSETFAGFAVDEIGKISGVLGPRAALAVAKMAFNEISPGFIAGLLDPTEDPMAPTPNPNAQGADSNGPGGADPTSVGQPNRTGFSIGTEQGQVGPNAPGQPNAPSNPGDTTTGNTEQGQDADAGAVGK